jgi:hypothetical protein
VRQSETERARRKRRKRAKGRQDYNRVGREQQQQRKTPDRRQVLGTREGVLGAGCHLKNTRSGGRVVARPGMIDPELTKKGYKGLPV